MILDLINFFFGSLNCLTCVPLLTFDFKVIMFEEVLKFKEAINLCYGWHKIIVLQQKVPKVEVWAIAEAFPFVLNRVVITYVMNQSRRHCLLFDLLNTCINLTLTLEAKVR
jgi:hypothetical protein